MRPSLGVEGRAAGIALVHGGVDLQENVVGARVRPTGRPCAESSRLDDFDPDEQNDGKGRIRTFLTASRSRCAERRPNAVRTGGPTMEGDWLTYEQAAERLNVSPEAVRQKAIRGRWQRVVGNDGRARVRPTGRAFGRRSYPVRTAEQAARTYPVRTAEQAARTYPVRTGVRGQASQGARSAH